MAEEKLYEYIVLGTRYRQHSSLTSPIDPMPYTVVESGPHPILAHDEEDARSQVRRALEGLNLEHTHEFNASSHRRAVLREWKSLGAPIEEDE